MNEDLQFDRLRSFAVQVRFEFIINELDLAITFCEIARTATDESKALRNLSHARNASMTARRFAGDDLTVPMHEEIHSRLQRLESLLAELEP